MSDRLRALIEYIRVSMRNLGPGLREHSSRLFDTTKGARGRLIALSALAIAGYALYSHPPFQTIGRSEIGIRLNRMTGGISEAGEGAVMVIPGLHDFRRYSLSDQIYRPTGAARADGSAPLQSIEGLSLGMD